MIKPRLLKNWVICCNRPMLHMEAKPAYYCAQCSEMVTYRERLAMEGAQHSVPVAVDISALLKQNEK